MTEQEAKEYAARYPCVRCGYCCHRGPCGFGHWDYDTKRCKELAGPDENGQYTCTIREKIMHAQGEFAYPMFDCGCSSPLFNALREWRVRRLELLRAGVICKAG